MATLLKKDVVVFNDVRKAYPPAQDLDIHYALVADSDLHPASRDWIGLFKVGWSSSRDYYTFEWVTELTNDGKGKATFAGRRLPPEDKHFYQFCYVSSDGRVRGASSPFQFSVLAEAGATLDDLELVEISEDSLMILQPKDKPVEKESPKPDESLKWKFEMVERENVQKTEMLEELDVKVVELEKKLADTEQQLQAKRDSETRLMEKLETEKGRCHLLEAAKTKEEAESAVLQHKVEELIESLKDLQEKNDKHEWESGKMKETVASLTAELDISERKTRELQEVQVDLMSQVGEKNQEIKDLVGQIEELGQKLETDTSALKQEREQILQELAVAQQNIAELLGAGNEGVIVNTPVKAGTGTATTAPDKETPPTRPAPQNNMVDKSAYEALQLCYENILEFHNKEAGENKKLRELYQDSKRKLEELEATKEEYRYRIDKCRQEYENKAREVLELRRNVNSTKNVELHDELTSLRAKLRDMEENQIQMAKGFDEAIAELSLRKQELKQKAIQMAEMDERKGNLEEELALLRQEFEDFQDKHDKVLHEKTAKMDQQASYLDEKVLELTEQRTLMNTLQKEKAKLENTVRQLRSQLDTLKSSVKSTDERACPVCNTKFPRRISQQDFERHVQAHFNAPA